jgi:two-component system phosphate regulon sensor histidine kinase PhoR
MQNSPLAGTDDYTRGFRRIVVALIGLVIVPTVLLLAVGLVMLIFYDLQANMLFGLLVVTLVACLITGAVLALVFLRREANLSRLQLDFVSKVSHELRTPLTSIRMFVETLRYEHDREKVETCLDVLQQETDRLSERIERLLDWGRMEAGRRNYHRKPERLASVIDESLREFRAAIVGQQRDVQISVDGELPVLQVDRAALVDALLNLLTNAHKYSPPDAPIEVRASCDKREVHIAVRDRGVGIAHHEHRRIFEKFYRSDDRLSRSVEGSGLGLSIVQHAAHGHGGSVTLHSEPGQGSTFTLNLPISPDAEALTADTSAPPAPAPLSHAPHVAEDSADRG